MIDAACCDSATQAMSIISTFVTVTNGGFPAVLDCPLMHHPVFQTSTFTMSLNTATQALSFRDQSSCNAALGLSHHIPAVGGVPSVGLGIIAIGLSSEWNRVWCNWREDDRRPSRETPKRS